ncbi:MAG: TonB-dependent receptor [Caulobacteraceae bacterium]
MFSTTGGSAIQDVDVTAHEIQGNSLVYGVFNDVDVRSENRFDALSSELGQISLTLHHEFSDNLRGDAFVGRSQAEHSNPVQTTLLWDHSNVDGYVYDYRGDNRLPLITYGGAPVTDPTFWALSQIRLRPQYVDNTFDTLYGDVEFDANEWLTVSGGLNWKNYDFESIELRRSNGSTANLESVIPGFAAGTPNSAYAQIITINGSGLSLPAGLTTSWAAPNVQTAAGLWNLYDPAVFAMGIQPALGNNFSVGEEDHGAYIQAGWSAEIAGMPFRGNAGVRYVETEQTATGYTFSGGAPVLSTVTRTYTDTLPAINMVLEPAENVLIRFGAADVMTRPNLGQLNPGAAVSVSGSNKTVTAGNPNLDPFRARAYDFSFEWYFRPEALFSIAYFYKDIDSFVQTVRQTGTFTGNPLGLPDSVAIAACGPAFPATCSPSDTNWQFSLPRNTPGGPLEGYEIGLQTPFFFLPGFWSNFGVALNYTHVESEIDYVDISGNPTVTADLTGLSTESWNATFYYEDERLSARISGAFRSDYLTTIPGRNGNTSESTAETFNVDFASSYAISDRLRLTFEGLNLTDEVSDQFLDPDNRSSFYHHYGRQVLAGVRFTY